MANPNRFKQKCSELFSNVKEKLSKVNAKKLLASRAFLVSGCAVLIVAAVGVSALIGKVSADPNDAASEGGKVLGNSVLVGEMTGNQSTPSESTSSGQDVGQQETEDRLTMTVLNRTAVREDAMAVLRTIAENPDALPDEKEEALAQITAIMNDMTAEANIETLAQAKGIPQCVAVISGGSCSIVVAAETLSQTEISRIVEIVYEQSGILPANTRVILDSVA